MDFASIRSEEYGERMTAAGTPQQFSELPVGTGPLIPVVSGKGDARAWRYAVNPDYWGDAIPTEQPKELPRQVIPPSTYGRITSYNVCYTKLLRPVSQAGSAVAASTRRHSRAGERCPQRRSAESRAVPGVSGRSRSRA